jgi:hypothetical protein
MILDNGRLRMAIEPALGCRVSSLFHLPTGMELLFPRVRPRPAEAYDPCGWDDCFPTVGAEPGWPDHGETWRLPFTVLEGESAAATLEARCALFPFRYRKRYRLEGDSVIVSTEIRNGGDRPQAGIWTLHALVRVEEDMVLRFPAGRDTRRPVHGADFAGRDLPPEGSTAKFWLPGPVPEGSCGIDYPSLGMAYRLSWNPRDLPYLGFWITRGGLKGDRNCAWEPSDGYHDQPSTARRNGALPVYAAGEEKRFEFRLTWTGMEDRDA